MSDTKVDSVRYVCMPGSPYTGSTLLGFLLNAHPECVSIGAATGLTRRVDVESYVCSCGRPFKDDEFWADVSRRTAQLGYPVMVFKSDFWNTHVRMSRRRWLNGLLIRSLGKPALTDARDALLSRVGRVRETLEEARWSTWALASAILEITGKKVFVDTARDHQRPKYLQPHEGLDLRVIHLIRDPRGTVSSIMGHTGVDVGKASRQWVHYNLEADRVRRYVPEEAFIRVRYEDLCSDPQGTIDQIADFVGFERLPLSDPLSEVPNHIIGNSMRLGGVTEVRLDEKWRDRLSPSDLATISKVTGSTSRRLGYETS